MAAGTPKSRYLIRRWGDEQVVGVVQVSGGESQLIYDPRVFRHCCARYYFCCRCCWLSLASFRFINGGGEAGEEIRQISNFKQSGGEK